MHFLTLDERALKQRSDQKIASLIVIQKRATLWSHRAETAESVWRQFQVSWLWDSLLAFKCCHIERLFILFLLIICQFKVLFELKISLILVFVMSKRWKTGQVSKRAVLSLLLIDCVLKQISHLSNFRALLQISWQVVSRLNCGGSGDYAGRWAICLLF